MLVDVYATEDAHIRVRVNLFNPGPICTWECAARVFSGEDPAKQMPGPWRGAYRAGAAVALPSAP